MVCRNQYAVFNLKSITSHLKMKGTMARGQSGVWLRVNEWIGMRYCVRSGLLSVFWLIAFCLTQYVYVCVVVCVCRRQEEASLAMCTWGRWTEPVCHLPKPDNCWWQEPNIYFNLDLLNSGLLALMKIKIVKGWFFPQYASFINTFMH